MPKIPGKILKTAFYLYPSYEKAKKGEEVGGTGFFVGVPAKAQKGMSHIFAVSNYHVAVQESSVIRINKIGGGVDIFDLGPEQWEFIPGGYDIAVAGFDGLDQSVHDIAWVSSEMFVSRERVNEFEIGPGENVFMAGRFIDLDGGATNAPALRFGNISTMPQPMKQECNSATHPSFCIDMHSRTGFSGSPVFVYRTRGDNLETIGSLSGTGLFLALLGIHWGQVPEYWQIIDSKGSKQENHKQSLYTDGRYVKGLSGMTCVAPAWAILDILHTPKIQAFIQESEAELLREQIAGQAISNSE